MILVDMVVIRNAFILARLPVPGGCEAVYRALTQQGNHKVHFVRYSTTVDHGADPYYRNVSRICPFSTQLWHGSPDER